MVAGDQLVNFLDRNHCIETPIRMMLSKNVTSNKCEANTYPKSMLSFPLSRQSLTISRANRCASDSSWFLRADRFWTELFPASLISDVGIPRFRESSTDLRKSSPHAEPSSDGKSDSAPDSSLPIHTPLSKFLFSLKSPLLRLGSSTCSPHQVPRYRRFRPAPATVAW